MELFKPLDAESPRESLLPLPPEKPPWERAREAASRLEALCVVQEWHLVRAARELRALRMSSSRIMVSSTAAHDFRSSQAALERLRAVARALRRRALALQAFGTGPKAQRHASA
jgi:hypothetical protein